MTLGRNVFPYTPILTGKAGELVALSELTPSVRSNVFPLVDVPPVPKPRPPAKGEPPSAPTPPADALTSLLDRLESRWENGRDLILDLDGFERHRPAGLHAVEFAAARVAHRDLWLAIAVSTRSSPAYRAAVVANRERLRGIAIRLHVALQEDAAATGAATRALLDDVHVTPPGTDVIVDFGRLPDASPAELADVALDHISAIPDLSRWRSVIVAGTSIPPSSSLASESFTRVRRVERVLWLRLQAVAERDIAFADYAVTGPRPEDDRPQYRPAPHLRYTTGPNVLIWKGRKEPDPATGASGTPATGTYPDLCRRLVDRADFATREFSWGDAQMLATAQGERGPGGPQAWVEHATNHHLTAVVRELGAISAR